MIEDVLDLAKKVSQEAEVYSVTSEDTPIAFEANRLKHILTRQSQGLALRIIKNGRIGFAATTKLDNPQELVDMAVEMAQFGAEARFHLPLRQTYPKVEVYNPAVESISIESMSHLGQSLIDGIRSHTPELICEASVSKRITTIRILNSQGGDASYRKSIFTVSIEGTLIKDTDMLFVGDIQSSCHPIEDVSPLARETIRQLEFAKTVVAPPVGQLPTIFTPKGVLNALIMPLTMAFNGKSVLQGSSPLGGRLGEVAFDQRLSVWDNPTLDFRPGSRFSDDEGIPTQPLPLIEKGIVANFLYDLQTAGLAGTRSTGSASRALGSLPSPSTSILDIREGDTSFDSMVADIKEGLVVEQLLGSTQGNILGGDFGGNVLLGYKVERGKIVGRVKNTIIAGNVYDILKELVAIGNDGEWVMGFLRTPTLYCPRVAISAKV